MTAEGAFTPDSDIDRIFGPVLQAQTYRHLLYSFIEFPLGILYFVTMIVGLSLGGGLMIIAIGFLILAVTLGLARLLARLEREISKALLGAVFQTRPPSPKDWRAVLRDRQSWVAVMYLILRFPLGVAGFVASVLMISAIPAMVAPVVHVLLPSWIAGERVINSEEAILISLFGSVFFLLAAHLVNAIAAVSRRLAVAML